MPADRETLAMDILCGVDALKKLGATTDWSSEPRPKELGPPVDFSSVFSGHTLVVENCDEEDVQLFFRTFPFYRFLLFKAVAKIIEIWGKEAKGFRLRVDRCFPEIRECPDCEFHRTKERLDLWIYILVTVDAATAIELEKKYDDWWIDHLADDAPHIHTHVEFLPDDAG